MSDEDWSNSDSESEGPQQPGTSTSVLLGLPDGPLNSAYDDADPTVSRAGGLPPFLRLGRYPPPEVSKCKVCKEPMELLVSLFCPFEGSANDRVLYVWACSKARCQRKEGSVRASRSLRYNPKYARKLQKKKERQEARAAAASAPPPRSPGHNNPFSISSTGSAPFSTGLGGFIFGSELSAAEEPTASVELDESSSEGPASDSEEDLADVEFEVAGLTISSQEPDAAWSTQPSYTPFYVSTSNEYLSSKSAGPLPKKVEQDMRTNGSLSAPWGPEQYEVMHKVDEVFEKFVSRVQEEPEQVVRYELSGVPLPYSSRDSTYRLLFPPQRPAPGMAVSVSSPPPMKPNFDPAVVPTCPACHGPRAFECQLMPNLINILRRAEASSKGRKKQTQEERQKELEALLKGGADGMEWGTIFVFSCLGDCCLDENGQPFTECWREEWTAIQWDET